MAKLRSGEVADIGGPGPCARLTREVLDRLASPEVRDAILSGALRTAELAEVPDDPSAFGAFACGPLRDCVEAMLGDEEASAVTADLSPAFAVDETTARSGVRKRKQRASLAAPREGAPVVLVASEVSAVVDTLVGRLKTRAKVIATYDLFALLEAATQQKNAQVTLLLHDEMAGLKPGSMGSLARMLPAGTRVIVWGAAGIKLENREAQVEWVELGNLGDIDAVADVCLASWSAGPAAEPEPARRVVIAHPDATWRGRASRILMDAGYSVVSAPDGFLALQRCIDDPPQAVIAGFSMDAIDGPQLASLLKSRFGDDTPPVLLVADGILPEPPRGTVAVIQSDALEQDLLPELAAWIGSG